MFQSGSYRCSDYSSVSRLEDRGLIMKGIVVAFSTQRIPEYVCSQEQSHRKASGRTNEVERRPPVPINNYRDLSKSIARLRERSVFGCTYQSRLRILSSTDIARGA